MFGHKNKRRTASNPPLQGANVNSAAATAATSAFLKNSPSSASLSSAAAAAALRSRPTSPVSVADVQTKRTLRRAGSTGSAGSAGSGSGRPGSQLQRRGSSGSMSERTFREPSPARSPSRSSQPASLAADDAPPVPAIPKNLPHPPPATAHRRASSLQAPAMRVASPPPVASGRGSSLGPVGRGQSRRSGHRTSLSSVEESPVMERPASRGSVNFSLPTCSRPSSPNPQWLTSSLQRARSPVIVSPTNQNLVYDPNTRSFLPQAQILAIEQRMREGSNQPVRKKKRIPAKQPTGTHLADGTVGERPQGPAADAIVAKSNQPPEPAEPPMTVPEEIREPSPIPSPTPEAPKSTDEKEVVVSDSDSDGDLISHDPVSSDTDTDVVTQPRTYKTRATTPLSKKPSIVREEEEEDNEPKPNPRQSLIKEDASPYSSRSASPLPLQASSAVEEQRSNQTSAYPTIVQLQPPARSADQPTHAVQNNAPNENGEHPIAVNRLRGDRVQSVSPARNAHFAATPNNLTVKHQPPPRSISPRKSALKQRHMARGSSPPTDIAGIDYQNASEASDELSVPRKKANRVSFDEINVVVGEAAPSVLTNSPVVQSPQSKKPWYSLNRGKKKGNSALDIDDDQIMKPRPALPSFGSVREKKAPREVQERALVTPEEYSQAPSPPQLSITTTEVAENPTSLSSDHAAGALLAQDAATKNAANISKSREPLPPQVTSVEGSGYLSDTSSTYSMDAPAFGLGTGHVSHDQPDSENKLDDEITQEELKTLRGNSSLAPAAAVLPPPIVKVTSPTNEWPDIPGGWNYSNSDSDGGTQGDKSPTVVENHAIVSTPASIGVAEPTPEASPPSSPTLGNIAAVNSQLSSNPTLTGDSEESDNDSIYSDAAEDLSDLEGDGFLSLDAIVDSPVVTNSQTGVALTTPESPTSKATKQKAYIQNQAATTSSEPVPEPGWQKAQEYWKGLTSDKKRQLELQAAVQTEDPDPEVEAKPAPKPHKKKSSFKKVIGSKGSEQRQPAQVTERSYMIPPGTKANNAHIIPSGITSTTPDNHMRRSMRSQGSMGGSLRGSSEPMNQRGSLHKKRPVSNLPPELKADPATVDALIRKLSAERAVAAPVVPAPMKVTGSPALRRRGSADSESSFKRSRPANSNEIPTFRSSMRGSLEESTGGRKQSPIGTRRFSLRSLSPASSSLRQPMTPPPSRHMQSSMRNSVGPTPTLRGNNATSGGKSSFRLPGFSRSGPTKPPTKSKSGPIRSSRFADSSDEEDTQHTFRSRFVESSDDEDEPLPRPAPVIRSSVPVRGIPKRRGLEDDGDSTDLPDSDDEAPPQKRVQNGIITQPAAQNGITKSQSGGSLRRSGSGRGAISPILSSNRPDKSNRGSFMGILRRKKPDPSSKVRKSDLESAARRDTPLERSRSDLAMVRANDRPVSPRLQKKNPYMPTRSHSTGGTWPLNPSAGPSAEEGAPFSGDAQGVATTISAGTNDIRPEMGSRQSTAASKTTDVGDANGINGVVIMTKKKKFGTLRRMFKLAD